MSSSGMRRRAGVAWRWMVHRFEPVRWLIDPADVSKQDVCLMVGFTATGTIARHTLAWCEAWHRRGFAVVLVVATDRPEDFRHDIATTPYLRGLLARRNVGYDFGSWVSGLAATRGIRDATLLAMANDSVYGPLDGFDAMLSKVRASRAGIIGITESHERTHHLQSFLVFYAPEALKSEAFGRFWKRMPLGGRGDVIVDRELKLLSTMRGSGLKVDILFPGEPSFAGNPTLARWRRLLADGFPFVKIQLLRDNPTAADIDGWEATLTQYGYDPTLVRQDLAPRFADSAAGRALAGDRAPDPGG